MGLPIADRQIPIFDWLLRIKAMGNWHSEIGNQKPTRYGVVALTSSNT